MNVSNVAASSTIVDRVNDGTISMATAALMHSVPHTSTLCVLMYEISRMFYYATHGHTYTLNYECIGRSVVSERLHKDFTDIDLIL